MDPSQISYVEAGAKLVAQLGFPIFVAVWLLTRTDVYLRALTDAVKELTNVIRSSAERRQ